MYWNYPRVPFETLKGKTIVKIDGMSVANDEIRFYCSDSSVYLMYHEQDCCESVAIDDVCGDVEDLLNSEVLVAEKNINYDDPAKNEWDESYTWTFYKIATQKGYVDLKWYGTSNGFYSEDVEFRDITKRKEE